MRIAIGQINPIMGYFKHNSNKIVELAKRAKEKRADVVVFGELSLFGYPPLDLLERPEITADHLKWTKKTIQNLPKGIVVVFGVVTKSKAKNGKPFKNSALVVKDGRLLNTVSKHLLPSYDVFDESRFFESDAGDPIMNIKGLGRVAVTICEDMWTPPKSMRSPLRGFRKADLIINLSASPFSLGHFEKRIKFAKGHAKNHNSSFLYVNLVGGQDELIFDGRSFLMDSKGKLIVSASLCDEDLVISDLKSNRSEYRPVVSDDNELLRSNLCLGLRDFVAKTGNKKVHLGISGGIDSALVAAMAVDSLGPNNVTGLILPGPFSSNHSIEDAEALAAALRIQTKTVSIVAPYNSLLELVENFSDENKSIVSQNIQARLRGLILMAFSNANQSLLLNTSNKSELAAGYSTLYGDLSGAISVIGDLTKRQVYSLANYYNSGRKIIPENTISKAPSAELAPNQFDQDSLPAYPDLDKAVSQLIECTGPAKSKTDLWLLGALFKSEFKRWQAPPILRVSKHAFGRGRRVPIAGVFVTLNT